MAKTKLGAGGKATDRVYFSGPVHELVLRCFDTA